MTNDQDQTQVQNESQVKNAIMKELDLEGLSEERQNEIIIKMGEVVLKKVFIQTVEKLSDEDQVQFEKMLDEKKEPEEVEKFLNEKIPDFEEMVGKIVLQLKEDLKSVE